MLLLRWFVQGQQPVGQAVYDLPPASFPPNPVITWTSVGILVPTVLRGPLYTQHQVQPPPQQFYSNNLLVLQSVKNPFVQTDWPNPRDYVRTIDESWYWQYNPNLIGKDQLPNRQQDWPNPYPVQWYQNWAVFQLNELELEVPFKQLDWPNPLPVQWYRSIEEWYNYNLVGKDQLPNRQQDWPLPLDYQRSPSYGYIITSQFQPAFVPTVLRGPLYTIHQILEGPRTWINGFGIQFQTPAAKIPFLQMDWPLPGTYPRLDQTWTYKYISELVGQDQLPNRQQYWPNPYPVIWYQDTSTGFLNYRIAAVPFNQYDWPLPKDYQRIDEAWLYKYISELVGQDVLPNRQQDWPLPRSPQPIDQSFFEDIILLFPPVVAVVQDLHFKPHLVTIGRMGALGGLS